MDTIDDFELDVDFKEDLKLGNVIAIIGNGVCYFKKTLHQKPNKPVKVEYEAFDGFVKDKFVKSFNQYVPNLEGYLDDSEGLLNSIHRYKNHFDKEPRQSSLFSFFQQGMGSYAFDHRIKDLLDIANFKWLICLEPYPQMLDVLKGTFKTKQIVPVDITRLEELDISLIEDENTFKVIFPFGFLNDDRQKKESPHFRTWPKIRHSLELFDDDIETIKYQKLKKLRVHIKSKSMLFIGCDYNEWEVSTILNSLLGAKRSEQTQKNFGAVEKLLVDDFSYTQPKFQDFYKDINGKIIPDFAQPDSRVGVFKKIEYLTNLLRDDDYFKTVFDFETKVFLAYSNYDKSARARNRIANLQNLLLKAKIKTWMDKSIDEGDIPDEEVKKQIHECKLYVFCLPLFSEFNSQKPGHYMLDKELIWACEKVKMTKISDNNPPPFLLVSREYIDYENGKDKNIQKISDIYDEIIQASDDLKEDTKKKLKFREAWNKIIVFDRELSGITVNAVYTKLDSGKKRTDGLKIDK